jgi:diaminopimelate epimerase
VVDLAISLATETDKSAGLSGTKDGVNVRLHFVKMHGLGNDFVMITDDALGALIAQRAARKTAPAKPLTGPALKQYCSALARLVCDRHGGIGGDGLIVAINLTGLKVQAERSSAGSYLRALDEMTAAYPERVHCEIAWLYVNSDGSYSAMCGNGLRCLTAFVLDLGWISSAQAASQGFRIATAVYPVSVCTTATTAGDADSDALQIVTRLAGPQFAPVNIPLALDQIPHDDTAGSASTFTDQMIRVRGQSLQVSCVSMGNPHCVVFEQSACDVDAGMRAYAKDIQRAHGQGFSLQKFPPSLIALAEEIQKLPLFPEGTNVEFVRVESPDRALVFVVERGCGPTLACASGAAAVLAAGVKTKRINKKSYVILPGGKLEASLSVVREQEYIELTGPAVQVFTGDFVLPANFVGFDGDFNAETKAETKAESKAESKKDVSA